ncbi:predicted histidine kinase [gamma proteobacterium HdN1]|nr:predicted histidine kinase [gamma proteobacterium HdN1]
MSLSPANQVRWQILVLAVIGSIGFCVYVSAVFVIALNNEKRLTEIVEIKQPLIEQLRRSEIACEQFRALLTNAISLEDLFMVEDAEAQTRIIASGLQAASQSDIANRTDSEALLTEFKAYWKDAIQIAHTLVEHPEKLYELQKQIESSTAKQAELNAQLSGILDRSLKNYRTELEQVGAAMQTTRHLGIFLGLLVILLMLGLAIAISSRAKNAITRSDRARDEFLSTLSHELRTPMNGILGSLGLLRETSLSPEQQQLSGAANAAAAEMLLAVVDLLAFSDFLNGRIQINKGPFSISQLLDEIIPRARDECAIKQISLQVTNDANPSRFAAQDADHDFTLIGDQLHTAHVLRHILSNAIKFTEHGSIRVQLGLEDISATAASGAGLLWITVRDQGGGVPEHLVNEIFQPFHQADAGFARKHGGMGIGLSICKTIIEALAGNIVFQNHAEGGAEVTIRIPIEYQRSPRIHPSSTKEPTSTKQPPTIKGSADTGSAVSTAHPHQHEPDDTLKLHILVVEDNKVNQMVINGYLKKMGCSVEVANNGQEGVDRLGDTTTNRPSFDLILMDCQMPVMDGFEATRRIRALPNPALAALPIIAVTANAMEGDRERCLQAGMNDYLSKPIDLPVLRSMICKTVHNHHHTPQQGAHGTASLAQIAAR